MKKKYLALSLFCSVPTLFGCSTMNESVMSDAARIQPVMQVRHSAATARGFYQLGRYYQGQNRLQQAAQAYGKAIELAPDHADARNALGTVYAIQGRHAEAAREFESLLQADPKNTAALNNLGYAHYLQGRHAEAIAVFEKAIELDRDNPRFYNNLGLAFEKAGEIENSRLAFERAASLSAFGTVPPRTIPGGGHAGSAAPISIAANPSQAIDLSARAISVPLHRAAAQPVILAGMEKRVVALATASDAVVRLPAPAISTSGVGQGLTAQPLPNAAVQLGSQAEETGNKTVIEAETGKDEVVAAAAKPFRFEISNGNGVRNMARETGYRLMHTGMPKPRLTNHKPFQQESTVIHFRHGYRDEALRLGRQFTNRPVMMMSNHLNRSTDVRLILGKDRMSQAALFSMNGKPA